MAKRKKLIRKIYPNSQYPGKIRGYYIPRQVAGPNPQIKFTDTSFSVGGPGLPETEFVPVEPEIFTGEDDDQARVDRILAQFNDSDILEPIAENGADLSQYGYARRKASMRKLILEWIATYGWSQAPPDSKFKTDKERQNHTMQNWFAGVRVYKDRKSVV